MEVPSDSEEEESATVPPTSQVTSEQTTDTNVHQEAMDFNVAAVQQDENFVDLLTPEAISSVATVKDDTPFVDLLTPENLLNPRVHRQFDYDEVEPAQDKKGLPKDPSNYMGGEFSAIEKPTKMLDRIRAAPDGKTFVYESSSSGSPLGVHWYRLPVWMSLD